MRARSRPGDGDTEQLWALEERFWTGGADYYCSVLHPECLMVFAEPAGILAGDEIVEGLEQAERWIGVEMTDRLTIRPGDDAAVLAYRAEARRETGEPYRCNCSSTYLRDGERWRLVQHQQTPAG